MKDYENTIEIFLAADKLYKEFQIFVMEGGFIEGLLNSKDLQMAQYTYKRVIENLKLLLEDRNAKLITAKDTLRQAVMLAPTQLRGPDGKPTVIEYSPFKVTSVTSRSIDTTSLFDLLHLNSVDIDKLLNTTKLNKDGVVEPIIKSQWIADYEAVIQWLRANNLGSVIEGSYSEKEKTPQVKGPKEIVFLTESRE